MNDTAALVYMILWLAAVVTLGFGCLLLMVSLVLFDKPAGQLSTREVLVPLWCLLAGPRQQDRLRAILARRAAGQALASGTLRDVARHRVSAPPRRDRAETCRDCGATRVRFIPPYHPGMGPGFWGFMPMEVVTERDADCRCPRHAHRFPDLPLSINLDILGS
jgi:hypothetical protein